MDQGLAGQGQSAERDAVGRSRIDGVWEWLLVEAKANIRELGSLCQAKPEGGLRLIEAALAKTKAALNADSHADWLNGYYQFANRLTVLHALTDGGEPARLLLIYFTGDGRPTSKRPGNIAHYPRDETEWADALATQERHLGLSASHPLAKRVHKLFLPANGPRTLKGYPA
jgi:hypothetical protein